jgi:hypothetical protein
MIDGGEGMEEKDRGEDQEGGMEGEDEDNLRNLEE